MPADLSSLARGFARQLQDSLNSTIAQHVKLKAALRPTSPVGPVFTVGSGLSAANTTQPTGFPLGITKKKPRIWMNLSYQVRMDEEQKYLMVHSSYCGIFADAALETCLCHFDYERDKEHYTSAHIQVYGASPALEILNREGDEKRPLEKLHFPVGGSRFRPCLEDIIEFLVQERLTDGRSGWQEIVKSGRDQFHRSQLRAAMRRDTAVAEDFIREQAPEGA
ncbi:MULTISPECIES: hypothetical protein [Actinomycetes]|uniref:hypothetical protein n=2 Tax=Actinomycetota TaxID=201174 RepID=UPI00366C6F60